MLLSSCNFSSFSNPLRLSISIIFLYERAKCVRSQSGSSFLSNILLSLLYCMKYYLMRTSLITVGFTDSFSFSINTSIFITIIHGAFLCWSFTKTVRFIITHISFVLKVFKIKYNRFFCDCQKTVVTSQSEIWSISLQSV